MYLLYFYINSGLEESHNTYKERTRVQFKNILFFITYYISAQHDIIIVLTIPIHFMYTSSFSVRFLLLY